MHYKSILELSLDIRSKAISPVEVTEYMLGRIAAVDTQSKSYVTVTADRAMAQARKAESEILAGQWRGHLHGIPLGIKDIMYTDFAITAAGTSIHKNFKPDFSATCVDRLELHGAITLGKLTTTEQAFAQHHPSIPKPVNPWGAEYFCGSSSSGSGVATACGLAFGTLGSDTGGSIRIPSAANGITGLKPTWGRVSRHGVFALGESFDHIGPMTRTAVDAGIMLGAIAGHDASDPTSLRAAVPDYLQECSLGLQGLRIGLPHFYATDDVDPQVCSAWIAANQAFASLGAELKDIKFPEWSKASDAWATLCSAETALAHKEYHPARKAEYGPSLSHFIEQGQRSSAIDVAAANITRIEFTSRVKALFEDVDLYLIPVFPTQLLTQAQWDDTCEGAFMPYLRYTLPADMAGIPTVTFPAGVDINGMPIAMQLCGNSLSEHTLLRAAAAFQRVTNWHLRRPM